MIIFMNILNLSIKYRNLIVNGVNNLELKMHCMKAIRSIMVQRHNCTIFKINVSNNIKTTFTRIFFILIFFGKSNFTRIIYFCIFWWMWLKIGIIWFDISWHAYLFTIIRIIILIAPLQYFIFILVCCTIFLCDTYLMWERYTLKQIIIIWCGIWKSYWFKGLILFGMVFNWFSLLTMSFSLCLVLVLLFFYHI